MKRPVSRQEVEQPQDQSIRYIPLTQHQIATVDASDFEFLNQWNWFAQWDKNTKSFYAYRATFSDGKKSTVAMHREILGCGPKEQGDHQNHDTLDNRRDNLRKCTSAQNMRNRRFRKNKFGLRGVRFRWNHWYAEIEVMNKSIHLGSFLTKEEAIAAHAQAVKKYHGEFSSIEPSPTA